MAAIDPLAPPPQGPLVAEIEQKGRYECWKETLSSLAPLIALSLIFIAAWSTEPVAELFRAHLEKLREHGNYDEVSLFYIGNYMFLVLFVPVYVCVFQYIADPDVYNRNERRFIIISVTIATTMFL